MSVMSNDMHRSQWKIDLNLRKLAESTTISEANKKEVLRFMDECYALGLSKGRVAKILFCIRSILNLAGKEFDLATANEEMLKTVVRKIQMAAKPSGEPLAESYISDMKVILKQYYKTMQPDDGECPRKAKWIKTAIKQNKKRLPEIFTKEEIERMVHSAKNLRMRAMIKVLSESGFRVGELLTMDIKSITVEEYGVYATVYGKTGERRVLLIESEHYLRTWLAMHPHGTDRNAPLWTRGMRQTPDPEKNRLSYASFSTMLKRLGVRAGVRVRETEKGVTSDVYSHLFRHTAASHLAKSLSESVLKKYMGWRMNSNMPQVYVHLSGRDIDKEIMKLNGISIKENEDVVRTCPRCYRENKNANYCSKCSTALTLDAGMKKEELRQATHALASIMIERNITEKDLACILAGKEKADG